MKVRTTGFPGGIIQQRFVRADHRKHRFCVYLGIRDNTVFVEPTIPLKRVEIIVAKGEIFLLPQCIFRKSSAADVPKDIHMWERFKELIQYLVMLD